MILTTGPPSASAPLLKGSERADLQRIAVTFQGLFLGQLLYDPVGDVLLYDHAD